ncbi:cupin domain-containing protein [Spirosoma endbachense]|uniref:Cupin domain-containing protein n=1 Tax=Spirosoma endbachense TaxID=2666025 RepID=A0A6P1W1V3_9BACT|nr:cupin domain-containing protein [Spirosoma endbachense]QHV99393.1 cupin domain-containing protein [Spirosoma endbachense]
MAYRNKVIRNPKTGQVITFLHTAKDTAGQFLGMIATFQPQRQPELRYSLPHQTLDLDVLSGELTVLINGQYRQLKAGEKLFIEANRPHALWNRSTQPTTINCRVRPALNTEHLLETIAALAGVETISRQPIPRILQTALTANCFSNVFRLTRWPFVCQKFIFILLSPVAYLAGFKPTYEKYID